MTVVSARYTTPLSIVLGFVALPVLVHSYAGLRNDDCSADSPPPVAQRMKDNFDAFEADEGSLEQDGTTYQWAVVRSFDAKKLYHHPEGGFLRGTPTRRERTGAINRLFYEDGTQAAYMLLYRGEPVGNPYTAHLAAFPAQLVTGTRPMTILFIWARGAGGLSQVQAAWLARTRTEFTRRCSR